MQNTQTSYIGIRLQRDDLAAIQTMAQEKRLQPAAWARMVLVELATGKLKLVETKTGTSDGSKT